MSEARYLTPTRFKATMNKPDTKENASPAENDWGSRNHV
jgi:hypothetical protein